MKKTFTFVFIIFSIFVFAQVPSSVPTNGLIAYWPFNGNANDVSGNAKNGTVTGATLTSDRFGSANSAYNFSGVNQFITCPSISELNGSNSASFSLWVKINGNNSWLNNNLGSAQYLLSRDADYSSTNIGIDYGPGNKLFGGRVGANYGNVVGVGSSNTYTIPQSTWHHIVFTIGGGFMKLYVDGVFNSSYVFNRVMPSSSGNLFFGKLPVTNYEYYLNGFLDDIGIWNRELTATEITNLYNYTAASISSPPVVASTQTFYGSATVANLVATGTALKWYDTASGGTALASTTALSTKTYYVSQTVGGSIESIRIPTIVTVNPIIIKSIGIIGGFNNWSADVVMNTTDNITYTLENFTLFGNSEMKFRQDGAWLVNWGAVEWPSGVGTQDGPTILGLQGTYNVTFNITSGAYSFVKVSSNFDLIGFNGGFNNFGATVPMVTADGTAYFKIDYQFSANGVKFVKDNPVIKVWGANAFPSGTATLNGPTIPLTSGFYNVDFNKNSLAYNFVPVPVSIIGDAAIDFSTDISMTTTDGINFMLMNQALIGGKYLKFRTNYSWATNWGGTTFPAGIGVLSSTSDILVDLSGNYNIFFNRVTGAYSFVTVNVSPIPQASASQTFCSGATIANLVATGTSLNWYDTSSGGTALVFTTVLSTKTYYVSQTVGGSLESTRVAVAVSINEPQITASATTVCAGTPVNLTASTSSSGSGSSGLPTNLQNGLVGYWAFNGNANDGSGNGNNGTVNGATLTNDRFGNANSAYSFNGANNFIDIANSSIAAFGTSSFTASGFYNCTISTGNLIRYDNCRTGSGWGIQFGSKIQGIEFSPTRNSPAVIQQLPNATGVWQSVTFVRDVAQMKNKLYINGVLVNEIAFSTINDLQTGSPLRIGSCSGFEFFNGKIDEVSLYNRALSPEEIQQLNSSSTYLWSTGETTAAINPTPSATTPYWCEVTTNGVTCRKEITITVTPKATPTFTPVAAICSGANLSALPTTSNSGIKGVWSPALNNTATRTYTFMPNVGQCATSTTMDITVTSNVTPTFNSVAPVCSSTTLSPLILTSNEGIKGLWVPNFNNLATTTYTFIPTPITGQCFNTNTITIEINTATIPTGNSNQDFVLGNTIANIIVNASNVVWYPTYVNALNSTFPLSPATLLVNGSTYYAVNVVEDCRSDVFAVTVNTALGVNQNTRKELALSPNPARTILTLHHPNNINFEKIVVTDLTGKIILTQKQNASEINVAALSSGIYIIEAYSDNKKFQSKFVKE